MMRVFTLTALTLIAPLLQAVEIAPEIQVEVIIFSQQDFYENEQARRDIELAFPTNHVRLIDPLVVEAEAETLQAHTACPENEIKETIFTETEIIVDETEEAQVANNSLEPIIEASYVLLDKSARQLNPDAYTLNRAPGYRVLFHKAWRQTKQAKNQSPWVLIRGGNITGEHYELEGAIKLYQSRYPHFQAKLWKTRWKSIDQNIKPIDPTNSSLEEHLTPWPTLPHFPEAQVEPITPNCIVDVSIDDNQEKKEETLTAQPVYQIENTVTLDQSSRVDYKTVTYLDHPNLGVLIKLSKYEAVTESDSTTDEIITPIPAPNIQPATP